MDSVEGTRDCVASLARSNQAGWAKGLSGSVPRSMTRIGTEAALASGPAVSVMVISPPFSGIAALLEVMAGGRSVARATRLAVWPFWRLTVSLIGMDLPAINLNSWATTVAEIVGCGFSTERR